MSFDLSRLFDPKAVDAEVAAFNERLEAELADLPRVYQVDPVLTRQARAEGRSALPVGGPLDSGRWQEIPGAGGRSARVRITEPDGPAKGVYLHIHGGGWTIGSPDQYDRQNGEIARACAVRVVSVQYRLAPEDPWPAQYDDCLAAANWVLEQNDLPVVIGGESAGAHLSAVTALALRTHAKARRICGTVLTYGVFDMRLTPSARNWGERYLILSTPIMDWFVDNVDPGAEHRGTPAMSPLLADLDGLPPALFQVGTADPLLDDTLFMATRWRAAGNAAHLHVYPGGIHGFDLFDLAISQQCRTEVAEFIRRCVGG